MITSLDFNNQIESQNELVIMPSGSFSGSESYITCHDYSEYQTYGRELNLTQAIDLFNPMKIPDIEIKSELVIEESRKAAEKLFELYKGSDATSIETSEVCKYADKIVELGVTLKANKYDVLICPLRGALKPTNYLKTMNVIEKEINWLPFTGASQAHYDNQINNFLEEILDRYTPESELFTVSIVDTAIGGNGSNKLADLINEVRKRYSNNSNWIVNFYLLHYPKEPSSISYIASIESKSTDKLKFIVHRFQVDNLIVEDWDSAIGLKVDFKGNSVTIKNSIQEGRIIIMDGDKVCVIDTPEISKYVDVLIASNISDAIRTHPGLTFVKEVWQDYINR